MRWCSPGFRPPPTRAVGDAGPYDRVPEHPRNSGPRKAPLQGELSAEPTEGSPPHPGFPTASHTGRRGRRPLRHGFGLPGSSGFRHCPTRATTRVAPTALFWDVCRGDPCGRPLLSVSDHAQPTGRRGRRPLRLQPGTLPQDEKIRSFTCRRHISHAKRISHYEVIFHPPAGRISLAVAPAPAPPAACAFISLMSARLAGI